MNDIYFLVTITKQEFGENFINFYKQNGVSAVFGTLCHGTAGQKTLDYLGIEKTEKAMLYTMVSGATAKSLMHDLIYKMGIDIPGNGIALTIPVGSVGGSSSMRYLTEGQNIIIGEVKEMNHMDYALIVAIAEKGTSDIVMEAARRANAGGGTIIHAKGTGTEFTTKFFGVSIASEKEMVFIVAKKSDKDNIMRAIMEKAGMNSDAHSAVFSLPVDSVVGLRSVTDK